MKQLPVRLSSFLIHFFHILLSAALLSSLISFLKRNYLDSIVFIDHFVTLKNASVIMSFKNFRERRNRKDNGVHQGAEYKGG